MGRPRIYREPRVTTAIRLPTSLRDELRSAAVERDVSVNFLVNRAVLDYLRRLPPVSDRPQGLHRPARHMVAKTPS